MTHWEILLHGNIWLNHSKGKTLISSAIKKGMFTFVAQMLFTFEQILDVLPNDNEWNVTITNQLKKHVWHLKISSSVKREEWGKPLQTLIESVID